MQVDGMALRREMARRQLTLRGFAKKAGLSPISVVRAMNSHKANTRTLGKLASALDIDDPTELLNKPQKGQE